MTLRASSVLQPHCGYMANSGMWLKTTMGVSDDSPAMSLRTKSIWSLPRWPSFSRLRVLTRAMKCTPWVSKLYSHRRACPCRRSAGRRGPVADGVVLARYGEDTVCLHTGQHLLDLVELAGRGQVGQVAADEVRPESERVDLVDRFGE